MCHRLHPLIEICLLSHPTVSSSVLLITLLMPMCPSRAKEAWPFSSRSLKKVWISDWTLGSELSLWRRYNAAHRFPGGTRIRSSSCLLQGIGVWVGWLGMDRMVLLLASPLMVLHSPVLTLWGYANLDWRDDLDSLHYVETTDVKWQIDGDWRKDNDTVICGNHFCSCPVVKKGRDSRRELPMMI